jgi:hypothetical protein
MAVVQEAFDIPSEIGTKLINGEYKRFGGVVRHAVGHKKGQIVTHLKPADIKETNSSRNILVRGIKIVKDSHRVSGFICIGATIISCLAISKKLKNKEPAEFKEYRFVLKCYLDAIRLGNLDLYLINNMLESIDKLKKYKDYSKFTVQLTIEDTENLVTMIHDYTIKLANDNIIEIEEFSSKETSCPIDIFESLLKAQRKVFKEAA